MVNAVPRAITITDPVTVCRFSWAARMPISMDYETYPAHFSPLLQLVMETTIPKTDRPTPEMQLWLTSRQTFFLS